MSDVIESFGEKTLEMVLQAIDWAYEQAAPSAPSLSEEYIKSHYGDPEKAIDSLILWQCANAGAVGFTTNLGGFAMMPATLPVNIAGSLYLQFRLIAAIAYLRGFDPLSEKARIFARFCLLGKGAGTALEEFGVNVSTKMSMQLIGKISGETLKSINNFVGFRLITKGGTTGLINLGKAVPLVGALVGGAFDVAMTKAAGDAAKLIFVRADAAEPATAAAPDMANDTIYGEFTEIQALSGN